MTDGTDGVGHVSPGGPGAVLAGFALGTGSGANGSDPHGAGCDGDARARRGGGRPGEMRLTAPAGLALDRIDACLLLAQYDDASAPARTLSAASGLSPNAVLERLRRLVRSGALLRRVGEIDEGMFAAWPTFLVFVTLTPAGRRSRALIDQAIRDAPEIMDATEMPGDEDLVLRVAVPTAAHWMGVQRQLDPGGRLIDQVRLRLMGGAIKRGGPHPLLIAAAR